MGPQTTKNFGVGVYCLLYKEMKLSYAAILLVFIFQGIYEKPVSYTWAGGVGWVL